MVPRWPGRKSMTTSGDSPPSTPASSAWFRARSAPALPFVRELLFVVTINPPNTCSHTQKGGPSKGADRGPAPAVSPRQAQSLVLGVVNSDRNPDYDPKHNPTPERKRDSDRAASIDRCQLGGVESLQSPGVPLGAFIRRHDQSSGKVLPHWERRPSKGAIEGRACGIPASIDNQGYR